MGLNKPQSEETALTGSCSGGHKTLRNVCAAIALTVAGAASGCAALSEAENQSGLEMENKRMADALISCRELKDMNEGILSEGTLGIRRINPDNENRISITKQSKQIDQVFIVLPSPHEAEGLTLEGDLKKLSVIKIGSYWGVQFKADYTPGEESKDAFVIQNSIVGLNSDLDPRDPGVTRYAIIIERR